MLQIIDPNGVDLSATPPTPFIASVADLTATSSINIQCLVNQVGQTYTNLSATINWDDGSPPVVYTGTGTIALNATRALPPGIYIIRVSAMDYAMPVSDMISVNFIAQINATQNKPITTPILYGPILPSDSGFPNNQQWNFNTGTDLAVIASSLKMLLITAKGERIALPEYGTRLRLILFEPNITGLSSLVQQEIVDAITKWEPRVTLNSLTVDRSGPRQMVVNATFTSKLNGQTFPLSLPFSQ